MGSCSELSCYFGAVCTERTGGALCECAAAPCPDTESNMLVSFCLKQYIIELLGKADVIFLIVVHICFISV